MEGVKMSKNTEELELFLAKAFSPQERVNIEKRLAILILLGNGYSYREIGEIVDVHRGTISAVKNNFIKRKTKVKKVVAKDELIFDWLPDIPMSKRINRN